MAVDVTSLDHIHIYSADPEGSAEFYMANFSATVVNRNHNTEGDARIFLALAQQILVIGPFPAGIHPSPPSEPGNGAFLHGFGVAHLGFRVDDVDAAVAELQSNGVRIVTDIVREPSGLSYAYVAAPDGVMVELTQY